MRTNEINIINIILRPARGTKLYSPICGDLFIDHLDDDEDLIYCRTHDDNDVVYVFTADGRLYDKNGGASDYGECLLFPSKDLRQWDVIQFEDGDVVVVEEHDIRYDKPQQYIMIFEKCDWSDGTIYFHVMKIANSDDWCGKKSTFCVLINPYASRVSCRAACQHEVLEINQALREHHLQWNDEKKCVEPVQENNEKPVAQFKFEPFDKVLVRDRDSEMWNPSLFAELREYSEDKFGVIDIGFPAFYRQCIPYNDDTKHLLGTSKPYKPKA